MFNLKYQIMKTTLLKTAVFSSFVAVSCILSPTQADAQKKVYLNSYYGTSVEKYIGQTVDVSLSRQMFNGWNTICLPFDMSASELNEVFGESCKLETLTDVNVNGSVIVMNFNDVKNEGIIAGKPYLLYYSGETKSVQMNVRGKELVNTINPISINGITFIGTKTHIDAQGHYGVLAIDNKDAQFVAVDNTLSGFYATRCYIDFDGGTSAKLVTVHNQTATSIKNISESIDINGDIFNLGGQKINSVQKGVNIINGKKVLVK